MKAFVQFLGFLYLSVSVVGQDVLIDFSTATDLIEIDTTNPNNVWQIGKPQKNFLDSALSGHLVIITDTLNPYPPNDTSSFIFKMPTDIVRGTWGGCTCYLSFSFFSKHQTDSLNDYGFIEFSSDSGNSWTLMDADSTSSTWIPIDTDWVQYDTHIVAVPIFAEYECYMTKERFTGQSPGWERISVRPCVCSIPHPKRGDAAHCYPTSLWFRFSFVSDSIANNLDGWMIDLIFVRYYLLLEASDLKEPEIRLYPNPASSEVTLSFPNTANIKSVSITDILGNRIYQEQIIEGQLRFSVKTIPNGMYYLTLYLPDNSVAYSQKLVIIH